MKYIKTYQDFLFITENKGNLEYLVLDFLKNSKQFHIKIYKITL